MEHEDINSCKPAVSVIVPVYNVENFLDRCVQSIVDQTLKDIEIILVDDGSTDNSPALCDAWASKDSRVRVLHKQNGGLSDARNAGIDIARADWLGFVDSDDYIREDMYESLLATAVQEHAQMAVGGVRSVYANSESVAGNGEQFVLNRQEAYKEFMNGERLRIWVVCKLYSKKLFENVRFMKGRTYEDLFIIADLLAQLNTVACNLQPFYYYIHHEGTITTAPYNPHTMDLVLAAEHAYSVTERVQPDALDEARFRVMYSYFTVLDIALLRGNASAKEDIKRCVAKLRENANFILNCPYVGSGRKLAMRALMLNVSLYKLFVWLEAKRNKTQ